MENDYAVLMPPKTIETVRKLAGDRAAKRLDVFNKAVKSYNSKAQKSLGVYSLNEEGEMVGSNIFARCLLDMVSPANTRRANIADLLLISDRNGKYLGGTFEDDNAVVLRSLKDTSNSNNNYLAKTLAKRLGVKRLEDPWVVTNLAVRDDEKSAYGLILVPTDATKMIVAPQLKKENYGRRFTLYDANGMPIFNDKTDKTGKRQVWTRDNGLSRLCLYWDLSLYSDDGDLANSNDVGRVVELSSEAADANFVRQLTQIYEAQQSELSQRFGATKKMSRGGK